MIYAIGDIHGQKAMLDAALALIADDGSPDAQIVFVGDYTDRGPDSRAVLDTLIAGYAAGRNWTMLKGNHDRFFSHYIQFGHEHDPRVASGISWLNPRLGGTATLASYGVVADAPLAFNKGPDGLERLDYAIIDGERIGPNAFHQLAQRVVPQAHLDFLNSRPLMHETGDLIFVHAGLRPDIALGDQDPEDLLWIRDGFLDSDHDFGKLVVHGHTALDAPARYATRVNLDGGAGYGRPLTPVIFDGRDSWLLTPSGRMPLAPEDATG